MFCTSSVHRTSRFLIQLMVCICLIPGYSTFEDHLHECSIWEETCSDGRCVSQQAKCLDTTGFYLSSTCPTSQPVKCPGELTCVHQHITCDGFCDCTNCTDEVPPNCHIDFDMPDGTMRRQGQLFPTGTLLLAGIVFVMWSVYVYFKRKVRNARLRHQAALQVAEASTSPITSDMAFMPTVSHGNYASSNRLVLSNHVLNVSIQPGHDAHSSDPPTLHGCDAPPAYSEVMSDTQYTPQTSLLQPQGSIPPPPSYDAATSNQQ